MRNATIFGLFLLLLLSFVVGCDREVTVKDDTEQQSFTDCFTCHGDDGYILAAQQEWATSVHASGASVNYCNRNGCAQCHTGQGFVEYQNTGATDGAPYEYASAIHCFTCHMPHESGNLDVLTNAAVTLIDDDTFDGGNGNLCANCHQARTSPSSIGDNFNVTSTHWGPHHGPQADVFASSIGYEYAGYTYTSTNHMGAIDNTCATCHMAEVQTHNGSGVGGHSFTIEDEEGNSIVSVCEGCHAAADDIDFMADADYNNDGDTLGYQTELRSLYDSLAVLLVNEGVLSAVTDGHPVAGTIADGGVAGALWNYLVVFEDKSMGIHNFNYLYGLMQSSIDYLNAKKAPANMAVVPAH